MKTIALILSLLTATLASAQTAKLYSATGTLKGTFSTVGACIPLLDADDSIVLSPHTFHEGDLKFSPSKLGIRLYGTVSGKDTTVVDATGFQFGLAPFYGTVSSIIFTGKLLPSSSLEFAFGIQGKLKGFVKISGVVYNSQLFAGSVDQQGLFVVENNKVKVGCQFDNSTFTGRVFIRNNTADDALISCNAIGLSGDTVTIKNTNYLKFNGETEISGNVTGLGIIRILSLGVDLTCNNVSFYRNNAVDLRGAQSIFVDSAYGGIDAPTYASSPVSNVHLHNCRFFNPDASGKRRVEVKIRNQNYKGTPKSNWIQAQSCWWGKSDTIGVFSFEPGTHVNVPSWSVADWFASPAGTGINIFAQMRASSGGGLMTGAHKGLTANYYPGTGSFAAASSVINTANIMVSTYMPPSSGAPMLTAVIDADTFRPSMLKLSIGAKNKQTEVHVYPNPAKNFLTIENASQGSTIALFDLTGKQIFRASAKGNNDIIDMSILQTGVYILKLTDPDGNEGSAKVVKE